MIRKRIGKELTIIIPVLTNGEQISLDGREIKVEVYHKYYGCVGTLPFTVTENKITAVWHGRDQKHIGKHRITVWENFDQDKQTAVDICDAIELVATTCQENDETDGLDVESIELNAVDMEAGMRGESAYQIWLSLGHEGTQEDFINWLRAPASDAAEKATAAATSANNAASAANAAAEKATAAASNIDETLAGVNEILKKINNGQI